MTLHLNELTVIYPEQLWVELSTQEQEYAWQQTAQQPYSNAAARWTAFVNWLCLNTVLNWLKEDADLEAMPKVWPQSGELPSFWEVVNGTKITVGETQLVLIPSDKSNLEEFSIPQEWVDIPSWTANYYLAVQLNLEEQWLRVWGYATHQQIRNKATYNRLDRTYSLDREDLIADLNVMLVAREICPPRQPEVKPLPSLSAAQAEKLLEQLGKQTPYSPRLDVAFEQWAALVESDSYRQKLYQLRLENQKVVSSVAVAKPSQSLANNLSQWFDSIFEAGWQSLDTLFSPQQTNLAVQFRSDTGLNQARIKGAKLIDLGMQLGEQGIVLLVGLTPEDDDRVSIRVQLHPMPGDTYVPPNLRLVLLSQSGSILQEVTARSHDHYIQLKRFKSPSGKSFSIQVTLGDVSIKEDFVLQPLVG
jgi:hypothetical protein